jgi:polysaccharide biosynthesis protein PslH
MKSILIIVPYEDVYPPMNGGMQRCFNIIHQLAKKFDLTLIIFQDKNSFLRAKVEYPAIEKLKIYSTKDESPAKDIFSLLPIGLENALRFRWLKKKFYASTDSMFLQYYSLLKRLLKQQKFDGIILENLATLQAVSIIRNYDCTVKIVYDAHNVDSELAVGTAEALNIKNRESNLHENVNALIACSERDRNAFCVMNGHKLTTQVIANGVNIEKMYDEAVRQKDPESILFCGSLSFAPNSQGLLWFYKNIWHSVKKSFPQLKLLVVGSGELPAESIFLKEDPSLIFSGAVEDVKPWYNKAALSIVPLLSGSGTRLKVLEAMSYGLPVVSTSKGAEGIEYKDSKSILIADKETDFANCIIALLKNKQRRLEIQKSARELVEDKYDWNVIGNSLSYFLKKINQIL